MARCRGREYFTAFDSRFVNTTSMSAGSHSTNGRGWIFHSIGTIDGFPLQDANHTVDDRGQSGDLQVQVFAAEPRQIQQVIHQQAHLSRSLSVRG